jgi:hypothetical protein
VVQRRRVEITCEDVYSKTHVPVVRLHVFCTEISAIVATNSCR